MAIQTDKELEQQINTDASSLAMESEIEVNDIYRRLVLDEALVMSMYRQDLQYVRKQLSTIKSRETAKLKDAGLKPDNTKLEFTILEDADKSRIVKVRIELKESVKVRIIGEIITLSGDLT